MNSKVREAIEKAANPKRKRLRLNGRGLDELPLEITEFVHLEVLELSGNKLTTLPSEISRMTNLRCLELAANRLVNLGPGLGALHQLEFLDIEANEDLKELPPSLGELLNLRSIVASQAGLAFVPEELAQCEKLSEVAMARNPFTEFPEVLLELPLTVLDLGGCPIDYPADIGQRLPALALFHCGEEFDIQLPGNDWANQARPDWADPI